MLLFHVVATGRCWIEVDRRRAALGRAGDVIVLPYSDSTGWAGPTDAVSSRSATLIDPPPWTRMPVIATARAASTDVVCGYLVCDDPLFDPRLRVLPPVFVVSPTRPGARLGEASIEYAVEQTTRSPPTVEAPTAGARAAARRDPRLHLAAHRPPTRLARGPPRPRAGPGTRRDPRLARAASGPSPSWPIGRHVSTSLLDERFREVLGLAPIRYLTEWRMHIAEDLLATTDLGVAAVARRVGYDSEEAFSRAFKREHGQAPSVWRSSDPA